MVNPVTYATALAFMPELQGIDADQIQEKDHHTKVQAIAAITAQHAHAPYRPAFFKDPFEQKSSIDTALEQLNQSLQAWATGMRFDMDPDSQRLVISLVDNETGEIIRTVPSEAVLQMAKMITHFQGNSINTKA